MTAIAINPRIVALAMFGAIASFGAQAQITKSAQASPAMQAAMPAPASIGAAAPMSNSAAVTGGATGGQASAAAIESCIAKTTSLLNALDRGDYAGAETDFNEQMRSGLTTDQLKAGWETLPQKFGARGTRGASQNSTSNGYVVITVPLAFQNGNLAAQVACGADGHIAGFHVMTIPTAPAAASSSPAPLSASSAAGH